MLDSHCGGLGIKGKTSNAWEVEGGMGNGEGTEEELPHFTLVCLFSWRGGKGPNSFHTSAQEILNYKEPV